MAFSIFWAMITSTDDEALVMEGLETQILASLGVADPYAEDPDPID